MKIILFQSQSHISSCEQYCKHCCVLSNTVTSYKQMCSNPESRAIMRFITHYYRKPGTELVYEVPKLQGIAATWIDVEDHQFSPPAEKLRQELVDKAKKGLPMDKEVVAEAEAKLVKVLDVYEERLKHSKYLGGDRFTSADLTHLPYLYHLMGTPVKQLFEERPNVSTWCKDILSRPCWSKVVEMVEKDKV